MEELVVSQRDMSVTPNITGQLAKEAFNVLITKKKMSHIKQPRLGISWMDKNVCRKPLSCKVETKT